MTISAGVTSIGNYAFSYCSSLTELTIPSSVTSIGYGVLAGCSGLERIMVEEGNLYYDSRENSNAVIRTAVHELVAGCKNTRIPSSVTSIGDNAFESCSSLTELTIPNSVTYIGNWAFYGCSSLTELTTPNSVTFIGNYAFSYCSSLTEFTIPNSVTFIGNWAFYGCSSLTSVTIGNSVTSIGSRAFNDCPSLVSVTSLNTTPPTIEIDWMSVSAFDETTEQNAILYVPTGNKEAYQQAEYWQHFLNIEEVTIEGIEPIEETTETTFSDEMDEDTDLSDTVIDNTYYNMDADNGDGYDATEQAIVLNSTTTDEQMEAIQNASVGDDVISENFNGIIIEVPAGSGTVTVDVKTIGTHVLNVKVGSEQPKKITMSERGTVDVTYNVTEPTYVYIYASTEESSANRAAAANSVLLYGYKVTLGTTDIRLIDLSKHADVYDLRGNKVRSEATTLSGLPCGIYVINGKKVVVK